MGEYNKKLIKSLGKFRATEDTMISALPKLAHAINGYFLALKIENLQLKKFDIFAQNIDCGYTFQPPRQETVLTSTHNLCFGAKMRKMHIPVLHKSGVQWGIYITRTCLPDVL